MQMVMTSVETQIQFFADWPMSQAKRVTKNNRKNPEYHFAVAIGRLVADKNCPAEKLWPNYVLKELRHDRRMCNFWHHAITILE